MYSADPGRIERRVATRPWHQQQQAGDGEGDPEHVAPRARGEQHDAERPGDLDRHCDSDRDPGERPVDQQVHPAQRQAVEQDPAHLARRRRAPPRPRDGEQDQRRQPGAQRRHALGPDRREQALGQGRADVEGQLGGNDGEARHGDCAAFHGRGDAGRRRAAQAAPGLG
jgi:hypothetical protein